MNTSPERREWPGATLARVPYWVYGEANVYERQSYRHVVGLPAIVGERDGAVRAETPFLVVRIMRDGTMALFATGRYLDALVEEVGALRFRERVVVCDSSRIDTLLAIPL